MITRLSAILRERRWLAHHSFLCWYGRWNQPAQIKTSTLGGNTGNSCAIVDYWASFDNLSFKECSCAQRSGPGQIYGVKRHILFRSVVFHDTASFLIWLTIIVSRHSLAAYIWRSLLIPKHVVMDEQKWRSIQKYNSGWCLELEDPGRLHRWRSLSNAMLRHQSYWLWSNRRLDLAK